VRAYCGVLRAERIGMSEILSRRDSGRYRERIKQGVERFWLIFEPSNQGAGT